MDVIGGRLDWRGRLLLSVRVQRGHLRRSHVCGTAVTHQGALALRVGGDLLFHLDVCAWEVLVAAHVKLQAEVTGGGKGTEFALKRLSPVLVLMYLGKNGDRFKCQTPPYLQHCMAPGGQLGIFCFISTFLSEPQQC